MPVRKLAAFSLVLSLGCSADTADRTSLSTGGGDDAGAGGLSVVDASVNAGGGTTGSSSTSTGGTTGGSNADAGPCTEVVDVVFALDVSSSMGFVLDQLESDIAGVVTSANNVAKDAHFGLIPFVDNHALDRTGPLEMGRVHTSAQTLQAAFASAQSTYTTPNRNPGDGPSGPRTQNPICEENALDALMAAVKDFPWRENATRVVILATDDTFLEAPDNYGDRDADGKTDKTDFPKEGNYPALHTLAATVKALKDARIRVFAFSRKGFTKDAFSSALEGPCGCGTGCRFGDSTHVGDGFWAPYKGQKQIPDATGGKVFDLTMVESGGLKLADTINDVVVDSHCNPIVVL